MNTTINVTPVFNSTWDVKDIRILAHQGGSRSSKTYSICQFLIAKALNGDNITCSIARASYTWLKSTAMVDFMDILNEFGLYNENSHNKTNHTYDLNGSVFSFVGLDESQKLRGRKQDIFWINEANECSIDDFRQVTFRTSGQIILDYNPSAHHHWIYEHVLTRPDCVTLYSTYVDNPFIPQELKREIEMLKDTDEDYWRVYGLGERGAAHDIIFPKYDLFRKLPEGATTAYGLDFGFTHPVAFVRVDYLDGALYLTELLYRSHLTVPELIRIMKELSITEKADIYADSARPDNIKEIIAAGFRILPTTKNVEQGLERMKRCRLFVHADSKNLIHELNNYRWKKDAQGKLLELPVKEVDDALDAARYAAYNLTARQRGALRVSLVKRR